MTDKTAPLVWIVCFQAEEGWTCNFSAHTNMEDAMAALDVYAAADDGEDEGGWEIRALRFNPVFNEE